MFQIGDRVKYIQTSNMSPWSPVDLEGNVIGLYYGCVQVEFDHPFSGGHSAGGLGKDKHCWNCAASSLILISTVETVAEVELCFKLGTG